MKISARVLLIIGAVTLGYSSVKTNDWLLDLLQVTGFFCMLGAYWLAGRPIPPKDPPFDSSKPHEVGTPPPGTGIPARRP